MRALPERQRQQSVLAVMDIYRQPAEAIAGSPVPGGTILGGGREIRTVRYRACRKS